MEDPMTEEIPRETVDEAIAELDRVRDAWLRHPEVTALDVGLAVEGRRRLDEVAIRVHVRKDDPNVRAAFPDRLGKFRVCFIEAEYGAQPP